MKKKASFSLLEVVVASSLTAMLALFFILQLKNIVHMHNAVYSVSERVQKENLAKKILTQTFSKTLLDRGSLHTYSEYGTNRCIFHYDAGANIDPLFSNEVIASIFLDKKKQLILRLSPKNEDPIHPEHTKDLVLLSQIEKMDFTFYAWDAKKNEYNKTKLWQETTNSTPHIVQVSFSYETEFHSHNMSFYLPEHHQLVHMI